MTTSGPPWQIFGSDSPEPETDEPAKPAPERTTAAKTWPTGPARPGATASGLVRAAPAKTEPARARPPWELPDKAEPDDAEPARARPPWELPEDDAGPAKAAPPWELPAGAEPVKAGPPWPRPPGPGPSTDELSARLTALAGLIPIASARSGAGGFSEELIGEAEELVSRADERLRLSAVHTVVALAGGTGGGKSSLFNCLAGADFSAVGVTRPVTRDTHSCVWGAAGSGPLLEWLGVPRRYRYARGSELDGGEASVHRHYLVPLASHSEVIAVVLNQADVLSADEVGECASDLRRLLDSEGLHDASLLVTSAVTGAGVDQLRKLLAETVYER